MGGRVKGSHNRPLTEVLKEFRRAHPEYNALKRLLALAERAEADGDVALAAKIHGDLAKRLVPDPGHQIQLQEIDRILEEIQQLRAGNASDHKRA